jgi:transcriptional regulator with XRE-family HTH domain
MTPRRTDTDGSNLDSTRTPLGIKLKAWRKAHAKPLKEVACEFGVSLATWNRWENGTRFPSPELLPLLAEYINLPLCHFFYPGKEGCENECPFPGQPQLHKENKS